MNKVPVPRGRNMTDVRPVTVAVGVVVHDVIDVCLTQS